MIDPTSLFPERLKEKISDALFLRLEEVSDKIFGSKISSRIRNLRSDGELQNELEGAIRRAFTRLAIEHPDECAILEEIAVENRVFNDKEFQEIIIFVIKHPSSFLEGEREQLKIFFAKLPLKLSERIDLENVVNLFLRALVEETWSIKEFQGIYSLMFQQVNAKMSQELLKVQKAQLEATLSIRSGLIQLADDLGDQTKLLSGHSIERPDHSPSSNESDDSSRLANLETYKQNLEAEINNNLVLELYDKLRYEDICITPFVHLKSDYHTTEPQQPLQLLDLINLPRIVLMGEPGSGKTTALRKLTLDILHVETISTIPIYISLSSFASEYKQNTIKDLWTYIIHEVSLYGCNDLESLIKLSHGQVLLLLDGWDEILDNDVLDEARRFLARTPHHFIITTRPEAQRTLPLADRYEMHPLSINSMRDFLIRRLRDERAVDQVVEWLTRDHIMRKLAENPLNLSIMTIVYQEEGDIGKVTRTRLYERAFEAIIYQHHRANPYETLSQSGEDPTLKIELILQNLAFSTMARAGGRFFSIRELNQAIQTACGRVDPRLSELMIGRLGIIRDRRSGRMEFFHLWYQEFLTARHLIETNTALTHLTRPELASVLLYTVGLLPSRTEAFDLLMQVVIHDPFNYCRAIPEAKLRTTDYDVVISRLIQHAQNGNPKIPVRLVLAKAIALVGISAHQSLARIARSESRSDYARRAALESISLLDLQSDEFDKILMDNLQTDSLGLLWHVIEHVGKRKLRAANPLLREYINHSNPIVVGDSIWALREMGEKDVQISDLQIEALLNCLSSHDKHVQGHAVRTLGRLKLPNAIGMLKVHLLNPEKGYRWIVPEAASQIGGPEGLGLVELSLIDNDPKVIATALLALSSFQGEVPANMIARVKELIYNSEWVPFLEESIGNIAWTTYQKLIDEKENIPR